MAGAKIYHAAYVTPSTAADFGKKTVHTKCAKRVKADRVSGIPNCPICIAITR